MADETFIFRTHIPASTDNVFAWHARSGALQRLIPPWQQYELTEQTGGIENGARVTVRLKLGPFAPRWVIEHRDHQPGRQFRDVQLEGPFASWTHTHRFEPDGPSACFLEDRIEYKLRFGVVGRLLAAAMVRKQLKRAFRYRHDVTLHDILLHAGTRQAEIQPMKILVSGSSGLIGSALIPMLTTGGHSVFRLVRGQSQKPADLKNEVPWNPDTGQLDPAQIEGFDAVVHLAGENIASHRWTAAQKARIRDSRVNGTRLLCETLTKLQNPPRTLVCASAIGIYGNRGDETLTETSHPGSDFLSQVCREWEQATVPAAEKGVRVVNARFGIILSPAGGALAKMLTPFKFGLGGVIGDGRQYMSWITIDDAAGALVHALNDSTVAGPVNIVSPHPATNREFTKALGQVLNRPTIFPMPAFAARLAFGEMADALLLSSARVRPAALAGSGYAFRHADLEPALRHVLGR